MRMPIFEDESQRYANDDLSDLRSRVTKNATWRARSPLSERATRRLRESMRRIDEARSRSNPVVIGPGIDQQTDHNGKESRPVNP